jgi:hypothetical protein
VTIMLRQISRPALLALILAAPAGLALAQQSATQAPPSKAPPKLERIEPGSDVPATTIPDRRGTEIKETRQGGQVTEAEVVAGGSHYYLKPDARPSNAYPSTTQPPQWKVGEFDLSGRRKSTSDSGAAEPAPADVPPPPPLPANANAGPREN